MQASGRRHRLVRSRRAQAAPASIVAVGDGSRPERSHGAAQPAEKIIIMSPQPRTSGALVKRIRRNSLSWKKARRRGHVATRSSPTRRTRRGCAGTRAVSDQARPRTPRWLSASWACRTTAHRHRYGKQVFTRRVAPRPYLPTLIDLIY